MPSDHDPEVVPMAFMAAMIAADEKHENWVRGLLARRGSHARTLVLQRVALPDEERARRRRLLDGARRGEPGAIEELWSRYRVRLIQP